MAMLSVATAILAAALAFLVEPLVGRLLLPPYGGAAAVWTTALVFFQAALLAGYALAHLAIGRLGVRRAALVQVAIVVLPLAALPVALPAAAATPVGVEPAAWLLGVLGLTVGAPFVALATTTPTLQGWTAAAGRPGARVGAFRLFAASNAGSIVGLLAYPTLVEPNLDLGDQARLWSLGYATFAALTVALALVVRSGVSGRSRIAAGSTGEPPPMPSRPAASPATGRGVPPTALTRFGWAGLAAIPAAFVVGTTTHLSTDVAAVPLLWVVPLAIYLGTFVLAFGRSSPIGLRLADALLPFFALGVALALIGIESVPLWFVATVDLGALACAGILVHGRLALARPAAERLTGYDLAIAAGGALGGLLAGVVAPLVLPVAIEGALALVVALAGRSSLRAVDAIGADRQAGGEARDGAWHRRIGRVLAVLRRVPFFAWYLLAAAALLLAVGSAGPEVHPGVVVAALGLGLLLGLASRPFAFAAAVGAVVALSVLALPPSLLVARTFYGVHRVVADAAGRHALFSGTTVQGMQRYQPADQRREPLGYYHRGGPIDDVIAVVQARAPGVRIGVLGLGVGALAAFGRATDELTFHEIDPAVERIARDPRLFTYLADSPAHISVEIGDGRLGIAAAQESSFDLVVVDAFSSDAVPVHLLTREAVELYVARLRPGALVAFNVSNRYVALEPVVAAVAADLGLAGLARSDEPPLELAGDADPSHWVVLARDAADLGPLRDRFGWRPLVAPAPRAWTDRFSDLLGAFGAP